MALADGCEHSGDEGCDSGSAPSNSVLGNIGVEDERDFAEAHRTYGAVSAFRRQEREEAFRSATQRAMVHLGRTASAAVLNNAGGVGDRLDVGRAGGASRARVGVEPNMTSPSTIMKRFKNSRFGLARAVRVNRSEANDVDKVGEATVLDVDGSPKQSNRTSPPHSPTRFTDVTANGDLTADDADMDAETFHVNRTYSPQTDSSGSPQTVSFVSEPTAMHRPATHHRLCSSLTGALAALKTTLHMLPIIPHEAPMRRRWDMSVAVAVILLCFTVPFSIAFPWWSPGATVSVVLSLVDVMFWVDILLNFRTTFDRAGNIVTNPADISRHYLRTWFAIDLLGSIPFEVFVPTLSKTQRKTVKLLKYVKLPKLLRAGRLVKYLQLYVKFAGVAYILFVSVLTLHVVSCLWGSIVDACVNRPDGAEVDGGGAGGDGGVWVLAEDVTSLCTQSDVWQLYSRTSYAAVLLLVGVADVQASLRAYSLSAIRADYENGGSEGASAHIFGKVCMLLGVCLLALTLSKVSFLTLNRHDSYATFYKRLHNVKSAMAYHGVPEELQQRVREYYDVLWKHQKRSTDAADALIHNSELSSTLRRQIVLHIYRPVLSPVRLLEGCSDDCLYTIATRLRHTVFMRDDVVVCKGDVAKNMWFVYKGLLLVVDPNIFSISRSTLMLRPGSHFGETALLENTVRQKSVCSLTTSELHELTKESFEAVLALFPHFRKRIAAIRQARDLRVKTAAATKINNLLRGHILRRRLGLEQVVTTDRGVQLSRRPLAECTLATGDKGAVIQSLSPQAARKQLRVEDSDVEGGSGAVDAAVRGDSSMEDSRNGTTVARDAPSTCPTDHTAAPFREMEDLSRHVENVIANSVAAVEARITTLLEDRLQQFQCRLDALRG